ncbi:hypothetical protein KCU88_g25, partial [Aureobasidium melanogenum]
LSLIDLPKDTFFLADGSLFKWVLLPAFAVPVFVRVETTSGDVSDGDSGNVNPGIIVAAVAVGVDVAVPAEGADTVFGQW